MKQEDAEEFFFIFFLNCHFHTIYNPNLPVDNKFTNNKEKYRNFVQMVDMT